MQKIAVIGATGMLGKPVTQQLIKSGFDITILVRDPSNAQKIFPGTPHRQADIFQPATLESGLQGMDAVYISISPTRENRRKDPMPEREGLKNILEAAKICGLKRVLFLSSLVQNYNGINGFRWWIFDMKQNAVEWVKKSGIPYTIFYPSSFMETVKRDLINGNKLMLTTGSVCPMWFVAGEDFGRQVARSLQTDQEGNHEYTIQGPEPFTWDEAASVIIDNSKTPLKLIKAPIGILKFAGWFNQKINYGYHICEALNKYPEKFESERTWERLGKPTVTLKEYIAGL